MAVPTDMDGFSEKIETTDTYSRLSLGDALLNYLGNNINSIECSDIGQFIDKLVPWLSCSNFKVSQKGLEIMTVLVERMRSDFKPYVPTVCPAIIDRLGDSHESVREKAQALLMVILDKEVLTPQQLFDRVTYSFSHKNSKVREEIMICLVNTINMYGSNSIALSKLTPHLVKLLADQNIHVREQAFSTLMEIYRRVGDRLRVDIQRRYASTINPSRLAPLMAKMEELRESGAVMTASEGRYEDEADRPIERTVVKKLQAKKPPTAPLSSTLVPGAVDEEFFTNAFEEVPTVQIFSAHDLKEMVNSIATTIGNPDMDWDKRVEAFKKIRSLLIAGAHNFEDFNELIKKWELPFVESLKDLRSHVVRETCVTIAYLAQTLGIRFARFAEVVFQNLIGLIQSSAKVIASAAFTSIRFIIQNVHNQRLLPIINNNMTSRSKEIRKAMCDVLDQLIHTWPLSILDKRIPLLQEAVKRGVSDADMEARISARRAYWAFKGYFPEQADALLATLDYSYKKNLYGDVSLSGSNQSLNQGSLTRQTSATVRSRMPGSATERSLSLKLGSSSSFLTSISREDYLLATSPCPSRFRRDFFSRSRSVGPIKGGSKSSLGSDIPPCHKPRKRIPVKRLPLRKPEVEKSEIVYNRKKKREFKKGRFLQNHRVRSVPCFWLMETYTSGLDCRCDGELSIVGDIGLDPGAFGDFCRLLPMPEHFQRMDLMQKCLKKSPKVMDNININPKDLNLSPITTGSRRIDKIKFLCIDQRRFATLKDAETMTELTGFQEEYFDPVDISCSRIKCNTLKRAPKIINLSRLRGYKRSLLRHKRSNRLETPVLKSWKAPKKLSKTDKHVSKSLVFLFKNKVWFGDEEDVKREESNACEFPEEVSEKGNETMGKEVTNVWTCPEITFQEDVANSLQGIGPETEPLRQI